MSMFSKFLGKITDGIIGDDPYSGYASALAQQGPGQYGATTPQWFQPGGMPQGGGFGYTQPNFGGVGQQQQGGGIPWGSILMGGGMLAGAAADLYGAHEQAGIDKANYGAQLAQQQMINGLVGQYMTPANQQNPYSSAIMNFLGQQNFNQAPMGQTQQPQPLRGQIQGMFQNAQNHRNGAAPVANESGMVGSNLGDNLQSGQLPDSFGTLGQPARPQGPQMYQYDQNSQAAQYNPFMLGQAPQVNAPMQGGFSPFGGAQAGQVTGYNPQMLGNLPQVGQPGQVMPDMVTGTQGANAGQDALLQMMRRDISAPRDASIDPMLQSGTGSFNNSGLMDALKTQDQGLLDEQVNQLRGSAGSFGQRFGSQMMKQEGQMRNQFATNVAARNASLQQQSFESAANRSLQGAGIQAGREQFFGQQPFQNAQLQQGAAGMAQQGGFQGQGMGLQAQLANQNAGLQAQQFNVGTQQNAQQFNAGNSLQAMLANQQTGLQSGLQNNQLAAQLGMFNAGNLQQAGLQGQQLQQLIGSQNQQAGLQGLLANQQMMGQYGMANQNTYNSAGQFNAGMQQSNSQFGAQQGNIYNQLMMSGMMNAGQMQNQQFGQNAQLLGILAGLGVPQQQVNPMYGAIGDAASQIGMIPMLTQMMQPQTRR